MKGHFHGGAEFYIVTALGVMIVFQVSRRLAGMAAASDNQTLASVGKAWGGLFSFPAQ